MGGYAEKLLAPGEVVVHRSHQHWLSLILQSRLAMISILVIVITVLNNFTLKIGSPIFGMDVNAIVFWAALLITSLIVGINLWQWRNEEYLITNRRLMKVTGIINKRSADSSLEKINDAILEENLFGRLLGYGDLDILTAADQAVDRYRMLARAKDFKKAMLEAKHALETGQGMNGNGFRAAPAAAPGSAAAPAPAPAPARPTSIAAQGGDPDRVDTPEEVTATLTRLAELRDSGAISAEDYEAKKQELLGRI